MNMKNTLRAIADAKHEGIQAASPDERVSDAVARMKARNIGALVVLDDDGRVIGIFTERDLAIRVVGEHKDPDTTKVEEVMTPDPKTVSATMTVEDAMRMVTEQRIRHLPLVTEGRLEALISSGDLMAWATKAQRVEIQRLGHSLNASTIKNKTLAALIVVVLILALIGLLNS